MPKKLLLKEVKPRVYFNALMLPLLYLFQIEKIEGGVSFDPIPFHHCLKGLQFCD
jgi:hypothetical protein